MTLSPKSLPLLNTYPIAETNLQNVTSTQRGHWPKPPFQLRTVITKDKQWLITTYIYIYKQTNETSKSKVSKYSWNYLFLTGLKLYSGNMSFRRKCHWMVNSLKYCILSQSDSGFEITFIKVWNSNFSCF